MEIALECNAPMILDESEKHILKSWTDSDMNKANHEKSWYQYRNSAQENKENIEPLVNMEVLSESDSDEGVGNSGSESLETVLSLSRCSIATDLDPPPVKRSKVVKPPRASESTEKSTPKSAPFSFLSRDKAYKERREARRCYYEMLMKKSSPQPFKAKPAPKFKSISVTPRRQEPRDATPKAPNRRESTSAIPRVLQPIRLSTASKPSSSLPRISNATSTATWHVAQTLMTTPNRRQSTGGIRPIPQSRIPRPPGIYRTPNSSQSKVVETTPKNPVQAKVPFTRAFNKSATPTAGKFLTPIQNRKPTGETPRKRPLTIPNPPVLSTAIRARERKQFEEMMQEKLRRREAVKRMEIVANEQNELERVAELRKSMVHRPVPLRERPSTHPMLPGFVNRPRWV